MRIAVMGSGGVGGYFGARLAKGGADVVFIARGAHLDAMRKHGLRIENDRDPITLPHVNVTDDAGSIGAVDLLLFQRRSQPRYRPRDLAEIRIPRCAAGKDGVHACSDRKNSREPAHQAVSAGFDEGGGRGRARGVALPKDYAEQWLKFADGLPPDMIAWINTLEGWQIVYRALKLPAERRMISRPS